MSHRYETKEQGDGVFAPIVSPQMLLDAGFNWFAFEMMTEELRKRPDFETLSKPFTFRLRGVKFSLEYDPETSEMEEQARVKQGLPARNPHYFKREEVTS